MYSSCPLILQQSVLLVLMSFYGPKKQQEEGPRPFNAWVHRISFVPHLLKSYQSQCEPKFMSNSTFLLKWGTNCCDICNVTFYLLTTTTYNLPTRKICSPFHLGLENLMQLGHQASNLEPCDLKLNSLAVWAPFYPKIY